ncbi:MAG: MBL fold metallo-hydrolase [Bacteroidetes bacterium]|nr:MAG: MBL fold metallo-hydrolase [Bacteroidota bacterium]
MRLRVLSVNPYQENTYLLVAQTGEAWVLDPGLYTAQERAAFAALLEEERAQLRGIYLTHAHLDHILGVEWVASTYRVPLFFHAAETVVYEHASEWAALMGLSYTPGPPPTGYIEAGTSLDWGGTEVQVLFVPGHSPGHVAFYLPAQGWLLSGDVLFRGSIGNYQLPLADYALLMHSLREKVLKLPAGTIVWPGHGPETTIGYERQTNPFLQAV